MTDKLSDPFADRTEGYKLYCLVHGAQSPEEMDLIEQEVYRNEKKLLGYGLWLIDLLLEWRQATGRERDDGIPTDKDKAKFDAWLQERVRKRPKADKAWTNQQ